MSETTRFVQKSPPFPGPVVELPLEIEPGAALGAIARTYITETRDQLKAWHDAGGGGRDVVEAFSTAVDRLVKWLFVAGSDDYRRRYVQSDQSCAVLAQGGYGRAELCPYSDIDLLFLYRHKITPYVEMITETILYALWDTRLSVGHAVRTPADCVRIAGTDLTAKTAMIDARYLCGDESLGDEFRRTMAKDIRARASNRFFREKLRESETRRHTYGDSVYLLEPQVKEGQGGLRDLHTALWIAKVRVQVDDLSELAVAGIVSKAELEEVEAANDFLFRVRNSLHFLTGTHQDQLIFDLQEPVAANLGYRPTTESELKPVEHFLRDYYLQAAEVTRLANTIVDRCVNPPSPYGLLGRMMARTLRPGVRVVRGELDVSEGKHFEKDPIELVRIMADAQRHRVKLSSALTDTVRSKAHLIGEEQRQAPELTEAFFGILRSPYDVYETLHEMHKLGLFERIIPEWAHLRCLVLHDFYHIYTVDEHSLMGIRELERLRSGECAEALPLLTEVMRAAEKIELLFLGVLMHDVGKGMGGGHSEKGADLARSVSGRFGLNEDDARELEFLVRNHLVLSHLAQRRDIQDEKLAVEIAHMVGSPESLKRLYLMTYADMRATGPKVWNNWKDMLLGETYLRVNEVFERGFEPEDRGARVRRIQLRVRTAVEEAEGAAAAQEFDSFLSTMPDTYFLRTPEYLISRDAELVEEVRRSQGLAVRVTHYEEREFTGFTVATRDRAGLFAVITGVLAASGMNIIGARISTSKDGIAVDSFRISHVDRREVVVDDERWDRIRQLLADVLDGSVALDEVLARAKAPGILDQFTSRPVAHGVGIDVLTSDQFTIVDVFGMDRVGLLHDIAKAIYGLGLEIHLAKISTAVDQVLDVFYVTEADGTKSDRIEEIRVALEPIVEPEESETDGVPAVEGISADSG